jgi:C_GCAxxG_C_C family probable redox protein
MGKEDRQYEHNGSFSDYVMSENHAELAMALFRKGYNCSQSVFLAFCDECGLDFDSAARLSSSFGAGMGRLREVCGAVTGMFMVAGLLYGYSDPQEQAGKTAHYQRIQDLAKQFEDKNHTIICRELLGLEEGKGSPVPELRTAEYYQNRPCEDLVGMAAAMIEEYIAVQKLQNREA